ncbi:MAG: energy transducer TonB [Chitinophagaceae bacterium]|nr:energy transducer TonB [Chitinophagaceae bacterium]
MNAFKDAPVNFKNSDQGTCRIRFIVDKKGNISNVEAMNMKRTRLAKFAVEIISNGPKWKPASQDGKFVNAYREQPITLTLSDK